MSTTFEFTNSEITQADLESFADERVNLKSDMVEKFRNQVNNLREQLERYIEENPDFSFKKLQMSGSLAKGTALSTINDVDVALYVKGDGSPSELADLLPWLVEKLRETFPSIPFDKIYIDGPCVCISFKGTGIDVEISPIMYDGDPDWRGYLWDRRTSKKKLTSIPLHLEFIRKRKEKQPKHFAQVVRLLKWWARQREDDITGFVFRSFLIELIMAKLVDDGVKFDDYLSGLESFFMYIQNTGLKKRISFTDNYPTSKLPSDKVNIVEIFDPVSPQNNVADDVTESQRKLFVELAGKALDTLAYARNCQTKSEAIECWQELMGSTFNA